MPKQQYLSRDDKGWKLCRRVPQKLQKLAGVTQWVERLAGATYKEACERANLFGVKTDAEIKKLSAALNAATTTTNTETGGEPGFTFQLTDAEIDQIAIAYFAELEQQVQKTGGYRRGVTETNRNDVLIDLAYDFERADAIATGNNQSALSYPDEDVSAAFHATAFKQLVRFGFIEQPSVVEPASDDRRKKGRARRARLPAEMRGDPSFQRLSDRLAEASAEIARRRLEANTQHRHPSLQNPLFQAALSSDATALTPKKQVRLGKLIDSYLAKRHKEVGRSRYDQLVIAMRALQEEVGRGAPLGSITREQCQAIADLLVDVPAWVSRHYKGLSLRKAADAYEKKHGHRAERHSEAKKHAAVLREVFDFAIDKE